MHDETMVPGVSRRALLRRVDARGWLLKLLMREHLSGEGTFGEIYLTAAHPGHVKGNHYHVRTREWFCVIEGSATLAVQVMASGVRAELELSAERPEIVEVAPGVAHAFRNSGSGMMVLFAYADEPYVATQPDEFRIELLERASDG